MNRIKFQKSLVSLVGWRERAFILGLAERALPNVVLYFESIEWQPFSDSHPKGLSGFMESVWRGLILKPSEEQIIELLDDLAQLLPQEVDEDHYGILPARDFQGLVEMALLGGVNDEKRRAQDASQRSLETITQFIEFSEGAELSENALVKLFDKHPLVEREFSFQEEMSEMLRAASTPSKDLLKQLHELARDEGVSNIGISLQ